MPVRQDSVAKIRLVSRIRRIYVTTFAGAVPSGGGRMSPHSPGGYHPTEVARTPLRYAGRQVLLPKREGLPSVPERYSSRLPFFHGGICRSSGGSRGYPMERRTILQLCDLPSASLSAIVAQVEARLLPSGELFQERYFLRTILHSRRRFMRMPSFAPLPLGSVDRSSFIADWIEKYKTTKKIFGEANARTK